jgi:uncharacterized protein YegP (UPF0339 family)
MLGNALKRNARWSMFPQCSLAGARSQSAAFREEKNMSGYFEIHKSSDDKFVFNLKADNNEIILTSQTYTTKQHALDGIESVRANSSQDSQYARRQSTANEPYFVLNAANGETIGSSQMYSAASAMENGIGSVKQNGATKTVKDDA